MKFTAKTVYMIHVEVYGLPKKAKEAPYHGRNILRWCDLCNIPVLKEFTCPQCGNETRHVNLAPPFDVRPALDADITLIQKTIEHLFGDKTGEFITKRKLVLLNASSYIDQQDEVILNGIVIGLLRYSIAKSRFEFHPKIPGALYIWNTNTKKRHWLKVDQGATHYIAQGKNVLAPGVLDFDETIKIDDPVIVVSPNNQVLATGIAKESSKKIPFRTTGMVIKTKDYISRYQSNQKEPYPSPFKSWSDISRLNESYLRKKEQKAIKFIRKMIKKHSMPVTVAFSGGKDSLVTLNLVRKATEDFLILYLDTGLELPETTIYVYKTLQDLGLSNKLITRRISPKIFWNNAKKLGPPGVDFRWCCKSSKLGPLNTLIMNWFHQRVLSFVGQRRYESHARARSPIIWRNPWVSNQIGVSPIKEWTAIEVWFYIMLESLPYNPLYNQGYPRVGCWLCPSSKMAHFMILKRNHEELWHQLMDYLETYRIEQNLPKNWVRYGLWRWKEIPSKFQHILEVNEQILSSSKIAQRVEIIFNPLEFSCVMGSSILKGKLRSSVSPDLAYIANLFRALGEAKTNENLGILLFKGSGFSFKLFKNSRFFYNFELFNKSIKKLAVLILMTIIRGLECTGCGACLGSCPSNALHIVNQKIRIDMKCSSCMNCLKVCPILVFGYSHLEERLDKKISRLIPGINPLLDEKRDLK
ncbi:MAG: phosphoadenosine phosphosulfate reductase family protein [Candidatus Hodarchaeota archaeon]